MTKSKQKLEWDLTERDRIILGELSKDPTISARELRDILAENHGIDTSRVTVSESIREMREAGVFREAIIPNEEYLTFSLFEFQFFPPNFEDNWRSALDLIRYDDHTLLFFQSDGQYQWKSVMMFADLEQEAKWIHEFYKEYGDLVLDLRNTVVTNVMKFDTHPNMFQEMTVD